MAFFIFETLSRFRLEKKEKAKESETPLMKQYSEIKAKYPDALLLFRVGDFYETFGEDAVKTSAVLGIVLTKRSNGKAAEIALAGFPHHALDTYLPKMVRAGYKVAICDQLEDPKMTKTIVKRGVTEMVTPGVITGDHLLQANTNNFLAAVHLSGNDCGVAFIDISTGEFLVAQGDISYCDKLLQSLNPAEVIFSKAEQKKFTEYFGNKYTTSRLEDWVFTIEHTTELLLKLFGTNSLKGFGIDEEKNAVIAAGAAVQYLKDTEHHQLSHINKINRINQTNFVWLDKFTIRNLELVYPSHTNGKSLFDVMDNTVSPMGARLLKRWILMPLLDIGKIEKRLDAVAFFLKNEALRKNSISHLQQVGDIERLISKISLLKATPREIVQLKKSLTVTSQIKQLLSQNLPSELQYLADKLIELPQLIDRIEKTLLPDAGALIAKGNFIIDGVDAELDELRTIKNSGKDYILTIQRREAEQTGISSLKVGFNNVFGYYLEVTNTHISKVPDSWIRKQTLANAERYITEELKIYEQKVLGAEEKVQQIEERLFSELLNYCKDYIQSIQQIAQQIAILDCLTCFAANADKYSYTRPQVTDSLIIDIKEGRHPVIEQNLPVTEKYIANDVYLDDQSQQILMITGPNMSGKSALLRQTALIAIMAQTGAYVPAKAAQIGLVDKIFTRVGASDNLSAGESTFMVEMNETANIMNNLSNRSLILLDEIGRGTSTYDGISIAWSIAEFLHNYPVAHPRTLFATHYHELNELAEKYPRIQNYHVATQETGNKVIFLRKLVKGGSEHSFGIHVAKMAGMPTLIIERAKAILTELEAKRVENDVTKNTMKNFAGNNMQLSFFDMSDPKLKKLAEVVNKIDVNTLTPIEALMKLNELKALAE